MLSQTKMQLWYPKKTSDEPSTSPTASFHGKSNKNRSETSNEKMKRMREPSPTISYKSEGNEEVDVEFLSEDSSRAGSLGVSDCDEEVDKKRMRGEMLKVSDFVDLEYWRKETICCGTIFRGMFDEVIVDPRFFKPCKDRMAQTNNKNIDI